MRIREFTTAVTLCLAAVPAFAQNPRDVTGPWTLNADIVTCTDLPITVKPIPALTVKGLQDTTDRLGMVTGDTVIVWHTPGDSLAIGQRYTASRLNRDEKFFPRPGEGYGGLRTTGYITITAINQWNALARVDFACDPIQPGDYLEPYFEGSVPSHAGPELYPDFSDRANILFGADNRTLVGMGDVVSIDRGAAHGVQVGARFAVYRDKYAATGRSWMNGASSRPTDPRSPLVYIGDVVVMAVSETTSKVSVIRSTDGIQSGDTVVPRRLKEPAQ